MNIDLNLSEQQHGAAVTSRTHETCLVSEPIAVTLDGQATSLSLDDAKGLLTGLQAAVARVEQSESALKGDDLSYNLAIIGPSRSGMSFPRSKLGSKN